MLLVQRYCTDCNLHWGSVVWSSLAAAVTGYDNRPHRNVTRIHGGLVYISSQPVATVQHASEELWPLWKLLSSITIWSIWKARCHKVFEKKNIPVVEFVRDIWLELTHMLKRQYDNIIGTFEKEREGNSVTNRNAIPSIVYLLCAPSVILS